MRFRVIVLWLLLGCCVVLLAASYVFDHRSTMEPPLPDPDAVLHIEIAMEGQEVSLVSSVVEEWAKWQIKPTELYSQYRSLGQIYSSRTVGIQWAVFDIPDGAFIRKQYFDLSTDPEFEQVQRFELRAGERNIELERLLVNTDYYFRITLDMEMGEGCVQEGHFKTTWSPRIMDVDNLNNIRDLGGWKTVDGSAIKQELLYRGCELDGASIKKYAITETAAKKMVQDLNIKTELDLRAEELKGTKDMLGADVTHRYFGLPSYAGCFTEDGNERLRQVFSALAVPEHYPVYLHCTNGADRTGIVCYLLEALLGVSEQDCYREWELSALANGEVKHQAMEKFIANLKTFEGDTLQEQTENYLLSIGVTEEEIETIRTIFLG